MGNTTFYYKVKNDKDKIDWKDIFSEYKKKHTKSELEYALSAGTSLNSATEADMLEKWQKPWMFYPLLKGGLILLAIMYVLFFVTLFIHRIIHRLFEQIFVTGLAIKISLLPFPVSITKMLREFPCVPSQTNRKRIRLTVFFRSSKHLLNCRIH